MAESLDEELAAIIAEAEEEELIVHVAGLRKALRGIVAMHEMYLAAPPDSEMERWLEKMLYSSINTAAQQQDKIAELFASTCMMLVMMKHGASFDEALERLGPSQPGTAGKGGAGS